MEGFLQRTGYAEDQILVSFASLVGDAFFTERKDVLVSDESPEYRAPLIAALTEKYLRETPVAIQSPAVLPARALILAGHAEVLDALKKLFADEQLDCAVIESASGTGGLDDSALGARVVAMPTEAFLVAVQDERFRSREFTFVAIEGADALSEQTTEIQRKIWGYLLPPWERRALLFASHVGIRTKNLAIDFANNPTTVVLKKAQASLNAISTSMYRVTSDRKFNVLLWLIQEHARQGHRALAVFCNLRQTSREVEARLKLNGIAAEHISSAAPKQKNGEIFAKFSALQGAESSEAAISEGVEVGSFVLTISNDNLEALPSELVRRGIHFDIPLDADVYLDRVRVMQSKGATMVGLACERYEVGLSAITSRFGTKFELVEPSTEMLDYLDASEGVPLELERPRRDDDRWTGSPHREDDGGRRGGHDIRESHDGRNSRDGHDRHYDRDSNARPGRESEEPRDHHESGDRRDHQNRGDQRVESFSGQRNARPESSSRNAGQRDAALRKKRGEARRAEARHSDPQASRESGDAALYSMSTEERLAFFRNKYKDILRSPAPGQGEKGKNKGATQSSPREAQKKTSQAQVPEREQPTATSRSADETPNVPQRAVSAKPAEAQTSASPQHVQTRDGGAQENGGIVKRFIDKLFSGDRESGADS